MRALNKFIRYPYSKIYRVAYTYKHIYPPKPIRKNPPEDPCRFCSGSGNLKCLKCDGKRVYIEKNDKYGKKMISKCYYCSNGTIICNFCGGSGESFLTY